MRRLMRILERVHPGKVCSGILSDQAGGLFIRAGSLELREPEFIIHDLIETDALALAFGSPGSGKSFFALDIACCVATGHEFHGRGVRPGPVIYIAGEGHNGIRRRLTAWEMHNGQSIDDAPLYLSARAISMTDKEATAETLKAIEEIAEQCSDPLLIIVDTLARNFGAGDENSTKDMNTFVSAVDDLRREFGATALIVHHTGHDARSRGRGSSVLKAALDTEFSCEKNESLVTIETTKMKDAVEPEPLHFKLTEVQVAIATSGDPITSAVLVPTSEAPRPKEKPLTSNQELAMQTFNAVEQQQGNGIGKLPGVPLEDWRVEFYRSSPHENEDSKRKAFSRARQELLRRGKLEVRDDVYKRTGIASGLLYVPWDTAASADEETPAGE